MGRHVVSPKDQPKPTIWKAPRWFAAAGVAGLVITGAGALPAIAEPTPLRTASTANAAAPMGTTTIWGSGAPRKASVDSDRQSVELGLRFTPTMAGEIHGIRFWKTAENTGTHVGNLWSSTGKRLASATFSNETKSGWQTVTFAKPVSVAAGKTYVASYLAPKGRYATTVNYDSRAASTALITLPARAGVYSYGSRSSFPSKTWQSSVYWVDVLFGPRGTVPGTLVPGIPELTLPEQPAPADPAPADPDPLDPAPGEPAPGQGTPTTEPNSPTPDLPGSQTPTEPAHPSPGATSAAFANSSNTGPQAAGFAPTQRYTGPMTITQPGTVVQNQVIPAGLRVEADNVTIQGNLIVGATDVSWDQAALHVEGHNVRVLDNEIRGESATEWRKTPVNGVKLVGDGVDFSRNNLHRIAGDGVSLYGANANVVGNWVHDFVVRTGGAHYDGLHYPLDSFAEAGLIKDNTVEMWITNSGDSGMTGAIAVPDSAPKLVVEHNLIAGGNYALMGGGAGGIFRNNAFWTKFSSKVGYYGPVAYVGEFGAVTWSGNTYTDDGITRRGTVK